MRILEDDGVMAPSNRLTAEEAGRKWKCGRELAASQLPWRPGSRRGCRRSLDPTLSLGRRGRPARVWPGSAAPAGPPGCPPSPIPSPSTLASGVGAAPPRSSRSRRSRSPNCCACAPPLCAPKTSPTCSPASSAACTPPR